VKKQPKGKIRNNLFLIDLENDYFYRLTHHKKQKT